MKVPTPSEHVRGIDVESSDKRPYIDRYLEAKGLAGSWNRFDLAHLAFNYVEAQFRVADIGQSIDANKQQRLDAQAFDVEGWKAKADRFIQRSEDRNLYEEMVKDFSDMAADSRKPDHEEREFMALGLAGRICEVVVKPEIALYSWQDPESNWDSGFN